MSAEELVAQLRGQIDYLRHRLREHDCAPGDAVTPSCPQDNPCTVCRLESALDRLDAIKADTRVTMQYQYQQVVP